jgi:hypothetical protein
MLEGREISHEGDPMNTRTIVVGLRDNRSGSRGSALDSKPMAAWNAMETAFWGEVMHRTRVRPLFRQLSKNRS